MPSRRVAELANWPAVCLSEICVRPQAIENVRMEIEVMRKVNHPNCITLETVYESANHIYIVMELVRVCPKWTG